MRKLIIGYWPLSESLNSAGDRRRLVFWATARGHRITTDLTQNVDVIVASENADFNSPFFSQNKIPIIFDLVDAYLSPLNLYDDFARGFAKKLSGQISGNVKPFSHHVRNFCMNSNAVVCSSIEQEEVIKIYSSNTHVILDSHEEIEFNYPEPSKIRKANVRKILWEGQPATIRGAKQISSVLFQLSMTNDLLFNFITDEKYFVILNRYIKRDTLKLLKRDLSHIENLVNVIPWTPLNLSKFARESDVAMIPIDLSAPMQRLKPENRLLIMWRLGLPCLTSPSPAYTRVAMEAGVSTTCADLDGWRNNLDRILNDPDFSYSEIIRGQNYLRENHNKLSLLKKWDIAFESVMG